ncbi:hypothetical protein BC941DRAFT_510048 [Chlamydoabsidia padenii]|nr:hypothetical protein BC941DRAFT_510048 [Chlamydoabsidia padenii]
MSLSLVRVKRKISCVSCRKRKVQCCGEHPCQRCINRKTPDECTYVKPGQAGRPPKNAVINKLVLNRTNKNENNNTSNLCNQFIFETVGYVKPTNSVFINNDSTKNLCYFINTLFNNDDAIMQIAVVRVTKAIPFTPDIKLYNLLEIYSGATSEILNVMISRISALTLDNFYSIDAIAAAVFQYLAFRYFSEPPLFRHVGNPLTTLPSEHAVQLINMFFEVSPHSIILNKTLLLQGYWTDSMDPLMLCVVYGTTIYLSKSLEGRPMRIWEAVDDENRNVFLDYTYVLVQKSSSEVSLSKYQAMVLLGLFEVLFGHSKRGLSILGLAFVIGLNLGVSNGQFQSRTDDIQAELANVTFWSLVNSTTRGGVELGQVFHASKKTLSVGLPPPSLEQSKSYQFEQTNGATRHYESYDFLVESFYTHSVYCRYAILILLELPEVRHNMFAPRTSIKALYPRRIGYPKPDDVVPRLCNVIQDFDNFIEENKHTWTKQQSYTLEMVSALLDIHIVFIKDIGPVPDGSSYGNSAYDFLQESRLAPDDPMTLIRLQEALPKVYRLMDKTQEFLSNPSNYKNKSSLLPRGLIVSVLETAMETLLLKCISDPWDEITFNYLVSINNITQQDIWVEWTAIQTVEAKLKRFFEGHADSSSTDNSKLLAAMEPINDWNSTMANTSYLTNVSFFDPCAVWMNSMRNLAVDLQLPEDISHNALPETLVAYDTLTLNRHYRHPGNGEQQHHLNRNTTTDASNSTTMDQVIGNYSTCDNNNSSPSDNLYNSTSNLIPATTYGSDTNNMFYTVANIPTTTSPIIQQILFDEDPFV